MPARKGKKKSISSTTVKRNVKKPLKENQSVNLKTTRKASVVSKNPSSSKSNITKKHPRKASTAINYSQENDDLDLDGFDDSSSEDENEYNSSDNESMGEENIGDPSQIYETIERLPKQRIVNRPKTSSNKPGTPGRGNNSLLKLLKSDNYEKAVSSWVGRYQRAARTATTELINLIIQCSGSQRSISEEQFETVELSDVMEQFQTERYMKSGGSYPLKGSTKDSISLIESYKNFWDQLLNVCRTNIIYDSYLMPSINAWLVTFSRSKLRPFRHVATLTSSQIVLSLSVIANSIREDLDQPQRLANAQKNRGSQAGARLKKRLAKMHQQIMDIEYLINGHFAGIFKRRYRDRVPLVRKISIKYLCEWMLSYSTVFVSDHYLKYLGWALSDRDADCRLNAVTCLDKLCSVANLLPHMENFISFYHDRILRMPCDVDSSVSSVAIRLLSRLAEHDYLEADDIKEIFKLISDTNSSIRYEAAKFIKIYQLDNFEEEERIADETDNQIYCRKFIEFIIENTSQSELPEYIVDSLWDPKIWEHLEPKRRKRDNPLGYIFLRDYEAMINLLIPESGRESELTSSEQAVLCKVMAASVKKSMGEDIVPKKRGEHNIRESAARQKRNQNIITRQFIRKLGLLLSKFQADGEKVESLLEIAFYFDLSLLDEEQCKDEYLNLCITIKEILLNRIEERVFANCAKVFRHFINESNPYKNDTDIIFLELEEELKQKIEDSTQMLEDLEEMVHHNGNITIQNTLCRINQLYSIIRLSSFNEEFVNNISKILYSHLGDDIIVDKIRANAIEVLSCHILWKLCDITKYIKENPTEEVDIDKITDIKRDETLLITLLDKFFTSDESSDELRYHCFLKLLDILTMFAPKLKCTALKDLAYDSGSHLKSMIKEYFESEMKKSYDHSDEEEIAKALTKKRKIITCIARAVNCYVLPQLEFGSCILLNLIIHDDKQIDDTIKIFFGNIRKQNSPVIESKLILKALTEKYDKALERGSSNALQGYKEFATKLGSIFPHRKMECQDSLHRILQAVFVEAVTDYPKRESILDGLVMFSSKIFPNRAQRIVAFCKSAMEEQYITDIEDNSFISIYLEYLEGVANKTNPSVIRKRIANRTSTKKNEEIRSSGVDAETLKEVAKQFDINYDGEDDSSDIEVELSDESPQEVDKYFTTDIVSQEVGGLNKRQTIDANKDDDDESSIEVDLSEESPVVDKYFTTDIVSQEVGGLNKRQTSESNKDDDDESSIEVDLSEESPVVDTYFTTDVISQEVGGLKTKQSITNNNKDDEEESSIEVDLSEESPVVDKYFTTDIISQEVGVGIKKTTTVEVEEAHSSSSDLFADSDNDSQDTNKYFIKDTSSQEIIKTKGKRSRIEYEDNTSSSSEEKGEEPPTKKQKTKK